MRFKFLIYNITYKPMITEIVIWIVVWWIILSLLPYLIMIVWTLLYVLWTKIKDLITNIYQFIINLWNK